MVVEPSASYAESEDLVSGYERIRERGKTIIEPYDLVSSAASI
jgi:hypothetical protein